MEAARRDISDVDTVADGDWPVDPDLVPLEPTPVRVQEERGSVVVSGRPVRSRRGVGLGVLAVLVIAVLAAALLWALSRSRDTPAAGSPPAAAGATMPLPVPSLVGATLADARRQLAERRLPVEVRRTPSRRPKDIVLAQSPEAGDRLAKGEKVLLVVAAPNASGTTTTGGAEQVAVPTVTGSSVDAATHALQQAGLKADEAKVPSTKPAGMVVGQNPATGAHVDRGSTVRLEIAVTAGSPKVTMPHVVGLAFGAATSQLRARGLRAQVEHVASPEPAGTVLGQTPVTGAQLRRGMTVTLRVAAAPAKVEIPDVTGLDASGARQQLTDAGFRVEVENQPVTDASQDGVVIDESPAGGSSAAKGSTVTITVGQATSQ